MDQLGTVRRVDDLMSQTSALKPNLCWGITYEHFRPRTDGICELIHIQHPVVRRNRTLCRFGGWMKRHRLHGSADEPDEEFVPATPINTYSSFIRSRTYRLKRGSMTMTSSPASTKAISELRIAAVAPAVTAMFLSPSIGRP